jgi:hypothetical protein
MPLKDTQTKKCKEIGTKIRKDMKKDRRRKRNKNQGTI